uniref:F-box domain-containing protein n=1 Tax=Lactuca sativa TaxID=4236 RepID=A0A9R1X187_LACSA|nr:hypothetical protein LSAT_V11C700358920 [Lactuca sativa]
MSMTRNQNHDDDDDDDMSSSSSSRKWPKNLDNGSVVPWSDVNHDVLFLIMMKLGFVDFFAFSGVCKSWRLFALSNNNIFMTSKPPMKICISSEVNENEWCSFEDFEGRKLKTILPRFAGRICIGSTCGYLVLFGRKTRDFWLVNPITRQELHFPYYPLYVAARIKRMRTILVFSASTSEWVFLVLNRKISFSIVGKRGWNHVSSTLLDIFDLHVFKGKIYIPYTSVVVYRKWALLETKNIPIRYPFQAELVSSGENLYAIYYSNPRKIMEMDFGKMKWVSPEKTIGDYVVFLSWVKSSAAIRSESWVGLQRHYKNYDYFLQTQHKSYDYFLDTEYTFYVKRMWYFPHD